MRVLVGVVAAMLMATPAFAQATVSLPPQVTLPPSCANFEAAPTLPDGATANHDAMTAAGERVNTWRLAREQKQTACQADIILAREQLDAMIQAYNNAGTERVAVIGAWNTEVREYSERGNAGNNRRERGGVTRPD